MGLVYYVPCCVTRVVATVLPYKGSLPYAADSGWRKVYRKL